MTRSFREEYDARLKRVAANKLRVPRQQVDTAEFRASAFDSWGDDIHGAEVTYSIMVRLINGEYKTIDYESCRPHWDPLKQLLDDLDRVTL